MRKDDKEFLTGLIRPLDQRIGGLEKRFDGLENRFDGLSGEVRGLSVRMGGLEGRFDGFEGEFRNQGVILEHIQDLIQAVAENTVGLDRRLTRVEKTLDLN